MSLNPSELGSFNMNSNRRRSLGMSQRNLPSNRSTSIHPRSLGGTTSSAFSQSKSFLSQYVPSYLEYRFNLPQYQLFPIRHRSHYLRTFSISPYIFKKINVFLLLFGGSLLSILLYILGFIRRKEMNRQISETTKKSSSELSYEDSKNAFESQVNNVKIETKTKIINFDKNINEALKENDLINKELNKDIEKNSMEPSFQNHWERLSRTFSENNRINNTPINSNSQLNHNLIENNIFSSNDTKALLKYISNLQKKANEEMIAQDTQAVLENKRKQSPSKMNNLSTPNNNSISKENTNNLEVKESSINTPLIENKFNQFSMISSSPNAQKFQNLISLHFDRLKSKNHSIDYNDIKNSEHLKKNEFLNQDTNLYTFDRDKDSIEESKNSYLRSIIDEFTKKDTEFSEYCTNILNRVDSKFEERYKPS